jgi:hypothetical protein
MPASQADVDELLGYLNSDDAAAIASAALAPDDRAAYKAIDQAFAASSLTRHAAASTAAATLRAGQPVTVGTQLLQPPQPTSAPATAEQATREAQLRELAQRIVDQLGTLPPAPRQPTARAPLHTWRDSRRFNPLLGGQRQPDGAILARGLEGVDPATREHTLRQRYPNQPDRFVAAWRAGER